jgi:anti-sigma regulatory factor (Ser/Thr protein kinase)
MPESVTLPGLPSMVPLARRAVRILMDGSPRAVDAELIVSEYAANAIRHTCSGYEGGEMRIVVDRKPGWARLEVHDAGPLPPGERHRAAEGEYGHGLVVVREVSDRWGQDHLGDEGVSWAELDWTEAL